MSDQISEIDYSERAEITYPVLGEKINRDIGQKLEDDVLIEALYRWKGPLNVKKHSKINLDLDTPKAPEEWVEYIKNLDTREVVMTINALGSLYRAGILTIGDLRKTSPADLALLEQEGNSLRVGGAYAGFLSRSFRPPVIEDRLPMQEKSSNSPLSLLVKRIKGWTSILKPPRYSKVLRERRSH